jgi:hypothetical protein
MIKKLKPRQLPTISASFLFLFFSFHSLFATAANENWKVMPNDQFQIFLEDYKANPTFLAENPDVIRTLSGDQLTEAIYALGFDHFTYLWPVVKKAEELPSINGESIEDLSVVVVRNGQLLPIPFQIDEMDKEGWVYIDENPIYDIKGQQGIFDEDDELLFMYRDTGLEQYDSKQHQLKNGKIIAELSFTDKHGKKRYAYLAKGSDRRSKADYVRFNTETNEADTTFYSFQTAKDNILEFTDFRAKVGDRQQQTVLDGLIVNIATNVFTTWTPRIELNNFDNLLAAPYATKDGTIRAVTTLKLWVVIAKIPVFRIVAQLGVWDQGLGVPVRLELPGGEILTKTLVNPNIDFLLDFYDMDGAHINAALAKGPGDYGVVDGKLDDFEKNAEISLEENWLWLKSHHGWDVMFTFDAPSDLDVGLSFFYEDDPKSTRAHETEPGAFPRMGYRIDRLPKDKLKIDVDITFWFPDTVGPEGAKAFHDDMVNPPKTVFTSFKN